MPRLVIFNQEANYLTTGLANAFKTRFESVTLIVGTLYLQGESLNPDIKLIRINRMQERPRWKKAWSYLIALVRLWWLLMTRFRGHEVLFVSVPPMGYLLNLVLPHRFSMVIWDLYPDTFKVTGMTERNWVYRIWGWLNRKSFRKAYRLFTIGDVLAEAISKYVPRDQLKVHPIWSMYRDVPRVPREQNQFIKHHGLEEKFIVQYSGNIGVTHNVELLIEIAEQLKDHRRILFQIIGRGPRLPYIERLVSERALPNVQFLPFQDDETFPHSISAANLGVVILNDKVSRGSVPSKAYNLMSFGIPALYISSPESQLAIDAKRFGHAQCFSAHQQDQILDFILQFSENSDLRQQMSQRALRAAENFQPDNARLFVESYFSAS
jgi:glycosyltransferase involved in cell wall biosynthesis